jgi:polysaccharide biosynthesis protein PslJ
MVYSTIEAARSVASRLRNRGQRLRHVDKGQDLNRPRLLTRERFLRMPSLDQTYSRSPWVRQGLLTLGAVVLGVAAGASVSIGPFWVGWVLLVALVAGYAVLRSTLAGLVAVLAALTLLPFGALPIKIAITPTLLELALLALLAVWMLRVLAIPEYEVRVDALGGGILLLLGFTAFSLFLGANGRPDNLTLHNYVKFALGVLLFFSILNSVRTSSEMRWVLRALVFGGAGAALIGLVLYVINDQTALRLLVALGRLGYPTSGRILRYVEDDPNGVERAIGTAVDPNSFGGLLAVICAFAAAQFWSNRPILPRSALIVLTMLMAVCTFLTYSRAALGGLVVATMFLATVRERRLWYVIGAATVVAIIAIVGLDMGDRFVERVSEGVQFRDQANQMRLAEFRNALEIIRRYPVFGVGFGTGPELGLTTGVSSIYLAMGQRIGLVGLGTFLAIMAAFFLRTFMILKQLPAEYQSWLLGIQAGLVAALAVGLLDHYYFNIEFSHMVALFWGMVGFGITILYLPRDEHTLNITVEDQPGNPASTR